MSHTGIHTSPVRSVPRGLFSTRVSGRAGRVTAGVRIVAGVVFLLFAIPKFAFHDLELAEFLRYGFPASSAVVYLVGLLELGAGLMLVLGLVTRVAAVAMAVNMAGAILTAGIHVGGPIHLGLAPALLVAMLVLLRVGPGAAALDGRLDASRRPATDDRRR